MGTFFNALSPLFFYIDVGVLLTSGALLLASLCGLFLQAHFAQDRLESSAATNSSNLHERSPRTQAEGMIEILDVNGQPSGVGRLINLSRGGAGFLSQKALPKGNAFMARFRLVRAASPITVSARVVWFKALSSGFIYGVQYGSSR